MRSFHPRALRHRGTIWVAGWRVHGAHLTPRALADRALAEAAPGARFYALGEDLLVVLARPELRDVDRGPGSPLVRAGEVLCGLPLSPVDLQAVGPPQGSVVLLEGGVVQIHRLDDLEPFDPGTLIDPGPITVVRLAPLGELPEPIAPAAPLSPRALLGPEAAVPPPGWAALRAQLREDLAAGPAQPTLGTWARLLAFGRALAAALRPSPAGVAPPAPATARPAPADEPTTDPRITLRQRLERWLAPVLLQLGLHRFLGARQAEYLSRLLRAFESGDLDQALKNALPLADLSRPASAATSLALRVPRTRSNLQLELGPRSAAGSALVLEDQLYQTLERQYRRAFERLDREGRVEEAAFVRTELLQEHAEAVAYLEQHGRLRLAAELAEARGLDPALVIRQWALAGDWARAIEVAYRTGAFGHALVRLKHGHPDLALELRRHWAQALAAAGALEAAVEVLSPAEAPLVGAESWVQAVLAAGGAPAARMLIKAFGLGLLPFAELRDRAAALLAEAGPENFVVRAELTHALLTQKAQPEHAVIARLALRALFRDTALNPARARRERPRLEALIKDPVLRTDLPALPLGPPRRLSAMSPLVLRFAPGDAGALPVHDLAILEDGRLLLALGELGVDVYDRQGRRRQRLDAPAHALVPADRGARAIALARRGAAYRLSRLDLVHQRATPWSLQTLRCFEPSFDGWRWFVGIDRRVIALDATRPGFEQRWQVEVEAVRLHRAMGQAGSSSLRETSPVPAGGAETELHVLGIQEGEGLEHWRFGPPGGTLRGRDPVDAPANDDITVAMALGLDGKRYAIDHREYRALDDQGEATTWVGEWFLRSGASTTPIELAPGASVRNLVAGVGQAAICAREANGIVVRVYEASTRPFLSLHLEGATDASIRFFGFQLAVTDDRGRALLVDCQNGELLASLRAQA